MVHSQKGRTVSEKQNKKPRGSSFLPSFLFALVAPPPSVRRARAVGMMPQVLQLACSAGLLAGQWTLDSGHTEFKYVDT